MRIIVKIKAKTNARQDKIEQISLNEFKVSVKESPEKGRANVAIIKTLQKYFHTKNVRIVSGHSSKKKLIAVE